MAHVAEGFMRDERLLLLIPARQGSKGLPGKNIARIGGFSLLERAVLASMAFSRRVRDEVDVTVCVDTDSARYAEISQVAGAMVPFLREPEFAGDTTSTADSTKRFLERLESLSDHRPTVIGIVQATSPLRSADDILACWRRLQTSGTPYAVSAMTSSRTPYAAYKDAEGTLQNYSEMAGTNLRRQSVPPALYANGAVYLVRRSEFDRSHRFIVPGSTSYVLGDALTNLDVDGEEDLQVASWILRGLSSSAAPQYSCGDLAESLIASRSQLCEAVREWSWSLALPLAASFLVAEGISVASVQRLRSADVDVYATGVKEAMSAIGLVGGARALIVKGRTDSTDLQSFLAAYYGS